MFLHPLSLGKKYRGGESVKFLAVDSGEKSLGFSFEDVSV